MPVDPELRAQVDATFGAPSDRRTEGPIDPLAEIEHLARTTKDARVKARLLTLLRQEQREAEQREASDEADLAEVSTEDLIREVDEWHAAALTAALSGSPLSAQFPETQQVVREGFERRVREEVARRLAR